MNRISVAIVVLSAAAGYARAQPAPRTQAIFFAPDAARTVTISRGASALGTISIPRGTLLAVEYESDQPLTPDVNGRFETHGHVVVRINAGRHADDTERLETRMAKAPVAVTGEGVDLVVSRGAQR